jgi:xylan 1,4-beta-xylosidase
VSQWRWELWNEPDIFYWAGTVEEYCRLYDHTVAGLHAALPQALVGGPGTTNPSRPAAGEFLRTFLEHCTNGRNAVSGEQGTRLDFLSFHTKGGGYRRDSAAAKQTPTITALVGHVAAGLAIIDRFPALAGREVILTECDPDGMAAFGKHDNANLRFRNTEYYASYVASAVCKLMDVGASHATRVDGMLTWAFQFEGREYFEGLRTLSTNGVDKPVLNVFRLLARLGGRRLALTSAGARDPLATPTGGDAATPPDVSGLAATDGADGVQVLLASHHDDWDVTRASAVRLEIAGLSAPAYHVRRSHVDADHGNAHTAWQALGEPQQPSADELRQLHAAARLAPFDDGTRPTAAGRLTLDLRLPTHAVCLVELEPARPAPPAPEGAG